MAEYIYKDMLNEQGWGMTFNATGRLPIIGSRIFGTLNDLNSFLNEENGTAIAGVIVAVVNDGVNNGVYRTSFISTDLIDSDNNIKCYDEIKKKTNLRAIRVVDADNQGGITDGEVVDGFYIVIGNKQYFVKVVTEDGETKYVYYNDNGDKCYYTYNDETIHTWILLNMVNGDKVYVNADELKTDNNTYAISGELRVDEVNDKTYIDIHNNLHPDDIAFSIDVTMLNLKEAVIVYDSVNDTMTTTDGYLTNTSLSVIESYIDNYDCGSFSVSDN